MKKSYVVVHNENEREPFRLTPDQIETEYSLFGSVLSVATSILPDDLQNGCGWERVESGKGVRLYLEGGYSAEELDSFAATILTYINRILRQQPKPAHAAFIVESSAVIP